MKHVNTAYIKKAKSAAENATAAANRLAKPAARSAIKVARNAKKGLTPKKRANNGTLFYLYP